MATGNKFLRLAARLEDIASYLEDAASDCMVSEGSKELREAAEYMGALVDALGQLVTPDCSFHGGEIRIPTPSHVDAIRRVYNARRVLGIE